MLSVRALRTIPVPCWFASEHKYWNRCLHIFSQDREELKMTAEVTAPTMTEPAAALQPEIPSVVKPTDPASVVSSDMDATETTVDASQSSLFGDLPTVEEATAPTNDALDADIPATVSTIVPKLDYASIPSFDKFTDLTNDDHYLRLPRDWQVLVADIEGSTKLIEAGRYRDVNTIGVSCIAAVRNALKALPKGPTESAKFNEDFPYVFGGDGASIVVAPHQFDAACDALRAVQTLSDTNYGMHLRIGSIPIAMLEDEGKVVVEVARYEIADGMCTACFRGGGLALADTWIKAGQGRIEQLPEVEEQEDDESGEEEEEDHSDGEEEDISDGEEEEEEPVKKGGQPQANLDGLSCRWNKIPSKNGCVLSVLVMHNEDVYSIDFLSRHELEALTSDEESTTGEDPNKKPSSSRLYGKVLLKLADILAPQNSLARANPVNTELATYKSAGEMIEEENHLHTNQKRSLSFWTGRAVEIGLCHVIFRMKQLQHAIIDAPAYTEAMRTHADHCKFDDMIRMVLDCTPEQADEIDAYLQSLHRDGKQVFYGTQRSQHTLMTCLLEDTNDGNHVHFVDGDLGGYAVAAKDMKLQLGNYALAKRGMNIRLKLGKQNSQKQKQKKKRKLRKTITK